MISYLTPEEVAQLLKVEPEDVLELVQERKILAVKIRDAIRIREAELERLQTTSPAVAPTSSEHAAVRAREEDAAPAGSRWCYTRTGKRFRVSGSVADGAEMWLGTKMRYPVKCPKAFMEALLSHFRLNEVPVGVKFDDPGPGSLGEYIQANLKTKMNPAVHLAALLIEEGYAESTRRGYIRFLLAPAE